MLLRSSSRPAMEPCVNEWSNRMNGTNDNAMTGQGAINIRTDGPYIKIEEQPAAVRYRYRTEKCRSSVITGVNSTVNHKSYPKIRIVNHNGPVKIVVSCVTRDMPYKVHPHRLTTKDGGCTNGIYVTCVNSEDMSIAFENLGVQCVKREEVEEELTMRESAGGPVDPFLNGFSHKHSYRKINLNTVRLCFQAFLLGPGYNECPLQPVVSEPFDDTKSATNLTISRLSHSSGSVKGGVEMILLCGKVNKKDIEILFMEEVNGRLWAKKATFRQTDIHQNAAITFKTPAYKTADIDCQVKVQVRLREPSTGSMGNPVAFFYTPDSDHLKQKKRTVHGAGENDRQNLLDRITPFNEQQVAYSIRQSDQIQPRMQNPIRLEPTGSGLPPMALPSPPFYGGQPQFSSPPNTPKQAQVLVPTSSAFNLPQVLASDRVSLTLLSPPCLYNELPQYSPPNPSLSQQAQAQAQAQMFVPTSSTNFNLAQASASDRSPLALPSPPCFYDELPPYSPPNLPEQAQLFDPTSSANLKLAQGYRSSQTLDDELMEVISSALAEANDFNRDVDEQGDAIMLSNRSLTNLESNVRTAELVRDCEIQSLSSELKALDLFAQSFVST